MKTLTIMFAILLIIENIYAQTTNISIPGSHITSIAVYEKGNKLFVADDDNKCIYVINGSTNLMEFTIPSVGGAIFSMVVNETSGKLYAASDKACCTTGVTPGLGLVSVINAETYQIISQINPGTLGSISYFYMSNDEVYDKIYLHSYNGVGVIDAFSNNYTTIIPNMVNLNLAKFGINTITNEVFIPDYSSGINVINGYTLTTEYIPYPTGASGTLDIAVNEAQNKVYLTMIIIPGQGAMGICVYDRNNGTFSYLGAEDLEPIVYNNQTGKLFSGVQVGQNGAIVEGSNNTLTYINLQPGGIAAAEIKYSTDRAYFASSANTWIIDGNQKLVAKKIASGATCSGLVDTKIYINQSTGKVYVVNCGSTGIINVFQDYPTPEPAGTISGNSVVCNGQSNVIYTTPVVTNATSYLWSLPTGATGTSTTNSIAVNYGPSAVSGNISVNGHNDGGNGKPSSLAITINTLPTAPVVGTITQPTCSTPTGGVILTGLPSSGTWTINPGAITGTGTSKTITGLTTGTYLFTVVNSSGCTSGVASNVVINEVPGSSTITGTLGVCAGSTTQLTGSGTPASINPWISASPSVATVSSAGLITGISAGTSLITYSNNAGCSITATVTVNAVPAAPTAGNASRCGAGTLTISATTVTGQTIDWYAAPSGGSALLSGNSSYLIPSIGTTTTYYAQARNTATGCVSVARTSVTATVNTLPTVPVVGTITQPTCSTPTGGVILTGLPSSGTWTINPGAITGTGTSKTITGLTTGTYLFTVVNSSGCTSGVASNVVINEVPGSSTITGTLGVCAGSTTQLTGSGTPASINPWISASPSVATVSSAGLITGISAGTSLITYSNNAGCSITATVTVNAVPAAPTAGNASRCGAGTLTISATTVTGQTIDWYAAPSGGSALLSGNSSYLIPSISTTTTYYAQARNTATGCVSVARTSVTATVNTLPMAPVVGTITQPTCSTPTGGVILTGLPSSGTWTINPGAITGTGTTKTITGLTTGTYLFTVANSSGCTSPASSGVIVNTFPETPFAPTVDLIIQPTCSVTTGSVMLNGLPSTGSWTLTRAPGDESSTGSGTSTTVTGLTTGTFTFTVANASGCISSPSENIIINQQPLPPEISGIISGLTSVCQGSSQIYQISPVSGATSYSWTLPSGWIGTSDSTSVASITGAFGGDIYVIAINSCGSGNQKIKSVTVEPTPANPVIVKNNNELESSADFGNQWYNSLGLIPGATGKIYKPLGNGNYYVIVNINGCNSIESNVISFSVGIENVNTFKNILIYPNPAKDNLVIVNNESGGPFDFEIVNSIGKSVYQSVLFDRSNIDIKHFTFGMYFIRFKIHETYYIFKFIKE